jgi:uncharacterized cupredoxin-like copper-binding protein
VILTPLSDAGPAPAGPAPDPTRRGVGRAVLAAAVAGAALAGGVVWLVTPGSAAGATTIAVTAHHSRFEPDRIKVKPNSTVRFVVHNADPIDHEFIIGPPETHAIHEKGTPHFHTGITPGEITVPAGATVETSWTFGPSGAPAPGGRGVSPRQVRREPLTIAYGCHLAGHWDYGMHGLAVIR